MILILIESVPSCIEMRGQSVVTLAKKQFNVDNYLTLQNLGQYHAP
ncbi:hypothetical protein V202x_17360 [Gimesia aquarii]|uniref:Uncharacterized protein n=1 Tax=Gimesia aquarii TaxID=2527964 RepID=A0A517WT11_9PLAN|nr:hypothetical protein V144x_50810 [Gimesia aquarii]QDU08368.1 hypothetical protein V202x_17360 [Gimesia aquarii]